MPEEKNIPEKKFVAGQISATIWINQGKTKIGKIVEFRTVNIQRRYKDKDGEWQTSNSYRIDDLPKLSVVINKAFEYLVLKEDPGKTRAL